MGKSPLQLQAKLMREYYKDFSKYSKGKQPGHKIAWVTSFTPVEILEALDIAYYYPESYAAVIAASKKEQTLLKESERQCLCLDCCNYSCCIEGSISLGEGPRGTLPRPDVLIATNNQCNTLPNWWNILAARYEVPLIVLDYPGEAVGREAARVYVAEQHRDFIVQMESLSGNRLDMEVLETLIQNSRDSVAAWERAAGLLPVREISPTTLFDGISFLITARCKAETAELYQLMGEEFSGLPLAEDSLTPLYWLGYPLWYHPDRFLTEWMDGCRISGANYITWWNLDYTGKDPMEQLFQAYNYTFLNLSQEHRTARLLKDIDSSGAAGAIVLHNKSCKCDFVSARNIGIPQVELEIDMIDRDFLDADRAKMQMEILKESLCTA